MLVADLDTLTVTAISGEHVELAVSADDGARDRNNISACRIGHDMVSAESCREGKLVATAYHIRTMHRSSTRMFDTTISAINDHKDSYYFFFDVGRAVRII